jgi:hypothetical protein
MNSDAFSLEGRVRGASMLVQNEKPRGLSKENVPHPENAHDGFPTTNFLLSFPFAIFDNPEISLGIDALCTLLDPSRRRRAESLVFLHDRI